MKNKGRVGQRFSLRKGMKVEFPVLCLLFSTYVYALIHSFIQQIFTEGRLSVGHYAIIVARGDNGQQKKHPFCHYRAYRLVTESVNNRVNKLGQVL